MSRQAIPIENLDAIIRDVSEALQTLKSVADSMRECALPVVYGHAKRVEADSVPRLWRFAEDLQTQFKLAKKAADDGKPDPNIAEIEKAKKTVARRQSERKGGKDSKNGKPK